MFALLDISQQQELMQYVLAQKQGGNPDTSLRSISSQVIPTTSIVKLTEIQAENLYFCLENRLVYICETESERVRHLRFTHHESSPRTHL